jgi:hypothetical protein
MDDSLDGTDCYAAARPPACPLKLQISFFGCYAVVETLPTLFLTLGDDNSA